MHRPRAWSSNRNLGSRSRRKIVHAITRIRCLAIHFPWPIQRGEKLVRLNIPALPLAHQECHPSPRLMARDSPDTLSVGLTLDLPRRPLPPLQPNCNEKECLDRKEALSSPQRWGWPVSFVGNARSVVRVINLVRNVTLMPERVNIDP